MNWYNSNNVTSEIKWFTVRWSMIFSDVERKIVDMSLIMNTIFIRDDSTWNMNRNHSGCNRQLVSSVPSRHQFLLSRSKMKSESPRWFFQMISVRYDSLSTWTWVSLRTRSWELHMKDKSQSCWLTVSSVSSWVTSSSYFHDRNKIGIFVEFWFCRIHH